MSPDIALLTLLIIKSEGCKSFIKAASNRKLTISLIIFGDTDYRDAFLSVTKDLKMPFGCIADLTKIRNFSDITSIGGDWQTLVRIGAVQEGTVFICLMAEQEESYRKCVAGMIDQFGLRLTFPEDLPEPEL